MWSWIVVFVLPIVLPIYNKYVYVGYLIKNQCYWPKVVTGDLIDSQFQNKEVGDVDMLEERTQENKSLHISCMKDTDDVMNIMAIWMTLDELELSKERIYGIVRSGKKQRKKFIHQKLFGLNFKYQHHFDDHNKWRHA